MKKLILLAGAILSAVALAQGAQFLLKNQVSSGSGGGGGGSSDPFWFDGGSGSIQTPFVPVRIDQPTDDGEGWDLEVGNGASIHGGMYWGSINSYFDVTADEDAAIDWYVGPGLKQFSMNQDGGFIVAGPNSITVSGAGAGSNPSITATGTDSDIGINLVTKANGKVVLGNAAGSAQLRAADGTNLDIYPQPGFGINLMKHTNAGDPLFIEWNVLIGNGYAHKVTISGTASGAVTYTSSDTSGHSFLGGPTAVTGITCSDSTHCGTLTMTTGSKTGTVVSGCHPICTDTTTANLLTGCSVSSTTITITAGTSDVVNYFCF